MKLQTVPERTRFERTASSAEILDLIDAFRWASDKVAVLTVYTSPLRRTCPAIVLASPRVATPEEAARLEWRPSDTDGACTARSCRLDWSAYDGRLILLISDAAALPGRDPQGHRRVEYPGAVNVKQQTIAVSQLANLTSVFRS